MKPTTESTTFTSMTKALIAIDCQFGSLGSVVKHIYARQITKDDAGSYRMTEPLKMYDLDRAG